MGGRKARRHKYGRENEGHCWRDAICSASPPSAAHLFTAIAGLHLKVAAHAEGNPNLHNGQLLAAAVAGGKERFESGATAKATASHLKSSKRHYKILKCEAR